MSNKPANSPETYPKWINLPIFLGPFLLLLPALLPGRSLFWGITSLQFIPWHWLALQDIQQGILPLLNSLNGLGAPLAANYQSALFYPPTWLVLFFGWVGGITWMAWAHGLLIVLHLIWAGWGMKSLTAFLGLSPISQVMCGTAFGLSGYLAARSGFLTMVQAAAWIPWILLAASQLAVPFQVDPTRGTRIGLKHILWLTLAFCGQWLSGHAQLAWYTLLFCCAWLGFGAFINGGLKLLIRTGLYALAAGVMAFLISSIQLILTFEYFLQSQRSGMMDYQTALSYSFWPWRIITFLIPDFFGNPGRGDYWGYANYWEDAVYIGILPIFFAFRFIFTRGKHLAEQIQNAIKPFIWFACVSIVLVFMFALGWFTPIFPWLFDHIPTFGLFNGPSRWMILVEVCLILLAGFGIEEWIQHGFLRRKQINIWMTVTLAGIAGAVGAWFILPEGNRTFSTSILASGIFLVGYLLLAIVKPKAGRLTAWRMVIVCWLTLDLIWAGLFLSPTVRANLFEPEFESKNLNPQSSGERYYWDSTQENEQRFKRFFKFEDIRPTVDTTALTKTLLPNINIISNVSLLNNFDPMVPSRFTAFMNEIANSSAEFRSRYLSLAAISKYSSVDPANIGEIHWIPIDPQPIVRLVACADQVKSGEDALDWLRLAANENRLESSIVVESAETNNGSCDSTQANNSGKVVTVDQDKGLVIEVENNPTHQWLFIARTWYPGWQIRIDGKQGDLLKADYVFMAVKVPAGKHTIELVYKPVSFEIGRWLSICGILVVILLGVLATRKENKSLEG